MRLVSKALLLAGSAVLFLSACAGPRVHSGPPVHLVIRLSPPSPAHLQPGTFIRVTVRPEPPVALRWVSGTVGILGAPEVSFRHYKDGTWRFRTMVPPMFSVPPGSYHVKAWGLTLDGTKVRGVATYEVE